MTDTPVGEARSPLVHNGLVPFGLQKGSKEGWRSDLELESSCQEVECQELHTLERKTSKNSAPPLIVLSHKTLTYLMVIFRCILSHKS